MVYRSEKKSKYHKLEALRLLYSLKGKQEVRERDEGIDLL